MVVMFLRVQADVAVSRTSSLHSALTLQTCLLYRCSSACEHINPVNHGCHKQ